MKSFSLTLTSLVLLVASRVYEWTGLSFDEASFQTFMQVVGELILIVGVYYGRMRKGDITWYGKRK